MAEINLEEKFPDLRPIRSVPSLFTVNGCGLTIYGARDHDPETGTYVKTHCVCGLFIPVWALGAYRVLPAQNGGYYFIGKEPLSIVAMGWNLLVAACLFAAAGVGLWQSHANNPETIAARRLAEADALQEAGQWQKSVPLYRDLALGTTRHAETAATKLDALLDGPIRDANPNDAADALRTVAQLSSGGRRPSLQTHAFQTGTQLIERLDDTDPRGALQVVEVIAPLAPDAKELLPTRKRLLETLVAREPDAIDCRCDLALLYEEEEDFEKCESLLAPHSEKLSGTEGARILGQILAEQGNFEEAHALLAPYCESRLEKLHVAEKHFTEQYQAAQNRVLEDLKEGRADQGFYRRYEVSSESDKQRMVTEHINAALKNDSGLTAAQEAWIRESSVVPVALNLGIVHLRRGQAMSDPDARRAELEKAEKTFLAIRGTAGESNQYRLFLGQVYYWLGKQEEGRKLFDELLEAEGRSTETLLSVGYILRDVGDTSSARKVIEEAYEKATDPHQKANAAFSRAIMMIDIDDEITWLERSNTTLPEVEASLEAARGNRALREGRVNEATDHYRTAMNAYGRMPETAASLNNGAIACLSLFRVSGEQSALEEGMRRIEKAVRLNPSDSILLSNAAATLLESAYRDVIGDRIDLATLRIGGSLELLGLLYDDNASRDAIVEQLRQHPAIKKGMDFQEKLVVLAPKRADAVEELADLHEFFRNETDLRRLATTAESADFDLADSIRQYQEMYTGSKDEASLKQFDVQVAAFEKVIESTRATRNLTFAAASTFLVRTRLGQATYGRDADLDGIVQIAEEAWQAQPSNSTRWTLVGALTGRAAARLADADERFAEMRTRTARSLAAYYQIAVAMSRDETFRAQAIADPDFARAVVLIREGVEKMPDQASPSVWAVVQATDPPMAERMAATIAKDEIGRLAQEIELRTSPLSLSTALSVWWRLQATGAADADERGREMFQQLADQGVPLPFAPEELTAPSE